MLMTSPARSARYVSTRIERASTRTVSSPRESCSRIGLTCQSPMRKAPALPSAASISGAIGTFQLPHQDFLPAACAPLARSSDLRGFLMSNRLVAVATFVLACSSLRAADTRWTSVSPDVLQDNRTALQWTRADNGA